MSTREEKKLRTKQAILDAAIALFSTYGYEHTSIEQIARKAGIGKGTIYGYFQTKKDIIRGFCEDELEKIRTKLVGSANQDLPVLDQMLTIYMTEFHHVTQNREFGRIYLRESVFPHDGNGQDNLELDDKYFEILFPILAKGQERGELRQDAELLYLTAHFYSLYLLVVSAWYTGRISTEEVEPAMELLFRQLLQGLQPPKDSQPPAVTDHDYASDPRYLAR